VKPDPAGKLLGSRRGVAGCYFSVWAGAPRYAHGATSDGERAYTPMTLWCREQQGRIQDEN